MKSKLVAFHGPKKSGKSTIAKWLKKLIGPSAIEINFADALKYEIATACSTTFEDVNERKDLYRPILQWWGTEFRRGQDKEYWTKLWMDSVTEHTTDTSVIITTDCRFSNELNLVHKLQGLIIQVIPFNSPYEYKDSHSSEQPLDGCDLTLVNDFNNIEATKGKVVSLFKQY